jgi:hypothetical protein
MIGYKTLARGEIDLNQVSTSAQTSGLHQLSYEIDSARKQQLLAPANELLMIEFALH